MGRVRECAVSHISRPRALTLGGHPKAQRSTHGRPDPALAVDEEGRLTRIPCARCSTCCARRSRPWRSTGSSATKTEAAVKAFQKAKKLSVDGQVGPKTWAAIIITVRKGSKGDAVRGVQEEFQFRNLSDDPSNAPAIDGDFGPKTEAAVRAFQDALDIAVDGIVGPVTWRALVSGMLSF